MLDTIIVETNSPVTHSIIWLHGLGADGNDFTSIVKALHLPKNAAIRFIFPHAPIRPVTINSHVPMRAWFDIFSLSDLDHEDRDGILASKAEIETLIEVEKNKGIDSQHIILAGFSQGGAIALYTGLRYPETLAGIFALSTYLPLLNTLAEQASSTNLATPIFLAHGKFDDILPQLMGEYTRDYLLKRDYSVEWHSYSMGHEVCMEEIEDISRWIKQIALSPNQVQD